MGIASSLLSANVSHRPFLISRLLTEVTQKGATTQAQALNRKRIQLQSQRPQNDPLRAGKCRSSRFPKQRGNACIWQPPSVLGRAFVREVRSIFSRWFYLFTSQQPFLGFICIYCRGSACGSGIAPEPWWCIIISADRSACWTNDNWQPLQCFHFASTYCCVSPWWNTCQLPAAEDHLEHISIRVI